MFEAAKDNRDPFSSQASQTEGLTNVEAGGGDEATDYAEHRAFDRGAALSKLKLTRGNIFLIGLFAAGIASVYFLSLRKGPETANASDQAVEQQVESYIAVNSDPSAPAKANDDTQKVMDSLYHYASRHQVPLSELKGNPFIFTDSQARATRVKAAAGPTPEQLAASKKRSDVEAEVAQLQLQSIMMGPRGSTAIINNNFLTEGQRIGSLKVTKIEPRSVELNWNGVAFTLRITE